MERAAARPPATSVRQRRSGLRGTAWFGLHAAHALRASAAPAHKSAVRPADGPAGEVTSQCEMQTPAHHSTPRLSAERIHESVQTQLTSIGARQSTIHYTTQSSPYYSARRNHHCTVLRDAITTALFCATQLRNHIALGHFATRRNQHLRGRT